jgi:hypothetical protein
MKYTTFRNIVIGVGVVLVGAALYGLLSSRGDDTPPKSPPIRDGAKATPTQVEAVAASPSDAEIMRAFEEPAAGEKKKDVFSASPVKVNFYADGGSPRWTRAKIDRDRDEVDDEKWDRDASTGEVKKRVTVDLGAGPQEMSYVWNGSAFVQTTAAVVGPDGRPTGTVIDLPPDSATPSGDEKPPAGDATLRPVDKLVLEFLKKPASGEKVKDAFPRETFKVNIYRDSGNATWNRLKIDLDRDEKDDEKWDLVDGQPAKRHVSSADDGKYDREYRWLAGRWQEKK